MRFTLARNNNLLERKSSDPLWSFLPVLSLLLSPLSLFTLFFFLYFVLFYFDFVAIYGKLSALRIFTQRANQPAVLPACELTGLSAAGLLAQ